jgi:hypothetical protein
MDLDRIVSSSWCGISVVGLSGPTAVHLLQKFVGGSRKNLSWNTFGEL